MLAVMLICFLALKSNPYPLPSPHSAGLRLGSYVSCPGHLEISQLMRHQTSRTRILNGLKPDLSFPGLGLRIGDGANNIIPENQWRISGS